MWEVYRRKPLILHYRSKPFLNTLLIYVIYVHLQIDYVVRRLVRAMFGNPVMNVSSRCDVDGRVHIQRQSRDCTTTQIRDLQLIHSRKFHFVWANITFNRSPFSDFMMNIRRLQRLSFVIAVTFHQRLQPQTHFLFSSPLIYDD